MPGFEVQIKADLEGITNLKPDDDIMWCLNLECTQCTAPTERPIFVSSTMEVPQRRGTTNFLMKCKICDNEITIDIAKDKKVRPVTIDDSGSFVPVVCFDSRGAAIRQSIPGEGWSAESVNGTKHIL